MCISRVLGRLFTAWITILLCGLGGAALVRLSPGFGVDEREMDLRLRADSVEALRRSRQEQENVARFYWASLKQLARGNLGFSSLLNRPIVELLSERLPVTIHSVTAGLLAGWMLALALALPVALFPGSMADWLGVALSGLLLCLPAAIVALLILFLGRHAHWAIALIIAPRIFHYARRLLGSATSLPHVLAARSRGLGEGRILFRHVVPAITPQMLGVAGVSVGMALGVSIPVEALCDSPGIGQLTWQAALGRDMPLLIDLTMLVTLITVTANAAADGAAALWSGGR